MKELRKTMFQPYLNEGWDFIHFNVELHDFKHVGDEGELHKINGEQVCSLETYTKDQWSIIDYLEKNNPSAQLIFTTTTQVPPREPGGFAGDSKRYNYAEISVLKDHKDFLINDLYTFSLPILQKYGAGAGNVHYKPKRSVAQKLGLEPMECSYTEKVIELSKKYEAKL